MKPAANNTSILALDVGGRRIGVARASMLAKLPEPLTTLTNDERVIENIKKLVHDENAAIIVVGLPRGMNGQETEQTRTTRSFYEKLKKYMAIPIYLQDEALTSSKAEHELFHSQKPHDKAMIDALAATYILEDFLRQHSDIKEVNHE